MSSDTVPQATPDGTVALPGTRRRPETGRTVSFSPAGGFAVALAPALGWPRSPSRRASTRTRRSSGRSSAPRACWPRGTSCWSSRRAGRTARRGGRSRPRSLELAPRAQHYLQACAQASVLLYWGWHWAPVYDAIPLIAGQLAFAYGFDLLLGWSRRDAHRVGFGPVPVVFSINLFLWFGDDWFYFQFLLVALGFAAKELLRWETGRPPGPHLQPRVVPARGLRAGPHRHRDERPHAGAGHRHLAVLSAAHVPGDLPDRAPRPVPLRRDDDDDGRGGLDLRLRPRLLRGHRGLLLLRLLHPDRRLPRDAPPVHGSVHRAAHRAGAPAVRRALRAEHGRALRAARPRRGADLLRQAAAGAAAEPVGDRHRPRRALVVPAPPRSPPPSAARWRPGAATWPTWACGPSCSPR